MIPPEIYCLTHYNKGISIFYRTYDTAQNSASEDADILRQTFAVKLHVTRFM
jgi:hypothetical protein